MIRELKFRAWFEFTDKYIKKELVCGKPLIPALHKVFYYTSDFFEDTWVSMSDYKHEPIVEQYVGLKDKNGNEIYEGDILMFKGYYCVVVYRQMDCSFILENDDDEICASMWKDEREFMEVVGNIHENPELLGGEE